MTEKYRPASRAEAHAFELRWCGRCGIRGLCAIPGLARDLDIEDPHYPPEWQATGAGPICTSYIHHSEPAPPPRCRDTIDMFSGTTEADNP